MTPCPRSNGIWRTSSSGCDRAQDMTAHPTPRIERMTDLSAAAWLRQRLEPWPTPENTVRVASIVPTGFAAYARLLHPAGRRLGAPERWEWVRWADVAAATGRTVHPAVDGHRLALPRRGQTVTRRAARNRCP